jgi:hypothetical protein
MTRPPRDPGVEHEPHRRQGGFAADPREAKVAGKLARQPDDAAQLAEQDVFDEPALRMTPGVAIGRDWSCDGCGFNLRGAIVGSDCPECGRAIEFAPPPDGGEGGRGYASWLGTGRQRTSASKSWGIVLLIALLGGPWAVLGALVSTWGGWLALVVVGPAVEEVMKVALIALLIETRPYLFKFRGQIAVAAAGSGLMFAVIENLIYLNVYLPDPSATIIAWRWIVCTALHVGCSAVAGVGAMRVWDKLMAERRRPDGPVDLRWLVAAIVIHGAYNAAVTVAELSGVAF